MVVGLERSHRLQVRVICQIIKTGRRPIRHIRFFKRSQQILRLPACYQLSHQSIKLTYFFTTQLVIGYARIVHHVLSAHQFKK